MSKLNTWAEVQLTTEQAIEHYNKGEWKQWSAQQVVEFQLFQRKECMDFGHFSKCVSEILGRPVFTHEFANQDMLVAEYLGKTGKPSLSDIIGKFGNVVVHEPIFMGDNEQDNAAAIISAINSIHKTTKPHEPNKPTAQQ